MSHTVRQLVRKIHDELQRAVDNYYYVKNPFSNYPDPGLPPGVNDGDDIAKIPDDPSPGMDPRKDSPSNPSSTPVAKTSALGQVVEHAISRKWGAEKVPESSKVTVQIGLESLIKTVGGLEEK